MARVILQPAGKGPAEKHYHDTIENPVSLTTIAPLLSEKDLTILGIVYPNGLAQVWGTTPGKDGGNALLWNRIQPGDLALFAGDNHLFSFGRVTHKLQNAPLAKNLWGMKEDGETWEYIYFLTEIQPLHIEYAKLNEAAEYSPRSPVRRFVVLSEEKSANVIAKLDLAVPPSKQEFDRVQKGLEALDSLDAKREALVRIEQGYLRDLLFGTKQHQDCAICGRTFPVGLLVAAHIKRRANCSHHEKLDAKSNVVPMCKFGCDDLFERKYIGVVNGTVKAVLGRYLTQSVSEYLQTIKGRKCPYWNDQSAPYFEWHAKDAGLLPLA
jgi:hypothetical protein